MKRTNWIVSKSFTAPSDKLDECFYCHQKIGAEHKEGCVIRQRTVVCRVSIDMVRSVPESWAEDDWGSWCASHIIENLKKIKDQWDKEREETGMSGCLCKDTEIKFLREANEKDEEHFGIKVKELES